MKDTDTGDVSVLVESLTKRELEILKLLAEHQTNNEIAAQLTLALSSVKWYIRQIFGKLGVNDRRQAIARALDLGLLAKGQRVDPCHNLPSQLTSFIGREKCIAQVKQMVASHRLVTLTGSGGVGKTRLALEVSTHLLQDFPDGVWLVELGTLSNPQYVIPLIASVFHLQEQQGKFLQQSLFDFLRYKKLLLILDNCEHLISACAQLLDNLLKYTPEVRILVTSREAIGVYGEMVYHVPSLTQPKPGLDLNPEALANAEAAQLFIERARTSIPNFVITPANAQAIAQICHRLDGIPLAIELAAGRVKLLRVEQIAGRLDDAFRLLTGGSRTALPRQQTLRATIEWSYNLLSEAECIALRRLSVFSGGWDLEAAEVVCCSRDNEQPVDVLDLLSSLASKSIVSIDREQGKETRYRLLEMIRQYGLEKLEEAGETEQVRDRHLDYFLQLAEQAEPKLRGPEQIAWLHHLNIDVDNLREALQWSLASEVSNERNYKQRLDYGLRMAGALWMFWELKGFFTVGRSWLDRALEFYDDITTPQKAKALSGAGTMAWHQGDVMQALEYHQASLAAYEEINDQAGIAFELNNVAVQYYDQALYNKAYSLFEQSLACYQHLGDEWGIGLVLMNLGSTAQDQGDPQRASQFFKESLPHLIKAGDQRVLAYLYLYMAEVSQALNRPAEVIQHNKESLSYLQKFGEQTYMMDFILRIRGDLALLEGKIEEAKRIYRDRLILCRELGDKKSLMDTVERLAKVSIVQGDLETSACLLGAADRLRTILDIPLSLANLPTYRRMLAGLQEMLESPFFEQAWASGQAVAAEGWEKVVTCALEHLSIPPE